MKILMQSLLFCISMVIGDARHKKHESCTTTGLSRLIPDLPWNYREQEIWGVKFPACISSIYQSPINLRDTQFLINYTATCLEWQNYHSDHGPIHLTNPGYTIEAISEKWASKPMLRGGPLKSMYVLDHLHFHWGADNTRGTEHILHSNTPMEIHFVHYNYKFESINDAMLSGEAEALAVVAVQLKFSPNEQANEGIATIAHAINEATGEGPVRNSNLPLGSIGLGFRDGYYTYVGSLTVPPCSPIVRWIVNQRTLPIGEAELRPFRNIQVNCLPMSDNFRNVQSINDGRRVDYHILCRG